MLRHLGLLVCKMLNELSHYCSNRFELAHLACSFFPCLNKLTFTVFIIAKLLRYVKYVDGVLLVCRIKCNAFVSDYTSTVLLVDTLPNLPNHNICLIISS